MPDDPPPPPAPQSYGQKIEAKIDKILEGQAQILELLKAKVAPAKGKDDDDFWK